MLLHIFYLHFCCLTAFEQSPIPFLCSLSCLEYYISIGLIRKILVTFAIYVRKMIISQQELYIQSVINQMHTISASPALKRVSSAFYELIHKQNIQNINIFRLFITIRAIEIAVLPFVIFILAKEVCIIHSVNLGPAEPAHAFEFLILHCS